MNNIKIILIMLKYKYILLVLTDIRIRTHLEEMSCSCKFHRKS